MIDFFRRGALALSLIAWIAAPAGATSPSCVGSCNEDPEVTVDEIITMVNIALGTGEISQCATGDADGSNDITVDEILQAVTNALEGCESTPVGLGTRHFEMDPAGSTIKAVLAPGFEINLGNFRGQKNGVVGNAFLDLSAGVPDPNTGLATVDVTGASDYIFASAQIAGITFCLHPIVPVTAAGVIDCDGGLDLSIGTSVDHVVGQVGEGGFTPADCSNIGGRVESPNSVCAVGLVGGECFLNSDCDTTGGAGDGVCGLATGMCSDGGGGGFLGSAPLCNNTEDCESGFTCEPILCSAGKEDTACRNAGDCDTAAGADDGVCGEAEAHPGACNGPVTFPQVGGDSGAGALAILPLESLGLAGLPMQLSIEQALPCGDEGAVVTQAFAVTTGKAKTTVKHFSGESEDLTFDQEGQNFSCNDFSTPAGERFVFGFPTLHLNPMSGGDLVIGFTFQSN